MHSAVQIAVVTIISYKPLSGLRCTRQYGSYMPSSPLGSISSWLIWFPSSSPTTLFYWRAIAWSSLTRVAEAARLWDLHSGHPRAQMDCHYHCFNSVWWISNVAQLHAYRLPQQSFYCSWATLYRFSSDCNVDNLYRSCSNTWWLNMRIRMLPWKITHN